MTTIFTDANERFSIHIGPHPFGKGDILTVAVGGEKASSWVDGAQFLLDTAEACGVEIAIVKPPEVPEGFTESTDPLALATAAMASCAGFEIQALPADDWSQWWPLGVHLDSKTFDGWKSFFEHHLEQGARYAVGRTEPVECSAEEMRAALGIPGPVPKRQETAVPGDPSVPDHPQVIHARELAALCRAAGEFRAAWRTGNPKERERARLALFKALKAFDG